MRHLFLLVLLLASPAAAEWYYDAGADSAAAVAAVDSLNAAYAASRPAGAVTTALTGPPVRVVAGGDTLWGVRADVCWAADYRLRSRVDWWLRLRSGAVPVWGERVVEQPEEE